MVGGQRGRKRGQQYLSPEQQLKEKRARLATDYVSQEEDLAEKRAKIDTVEHDSHGKLEGLVFTLGEGDTGQLGLGPDVMERSKPGQVTLPEEAVQICAGGMHTACLTKAGHVYTWGCNDEGALGRPTPEEDDCMEAGKVDLDETIVQISAGDSHTAALTKKGSVFAWGTFRDANGPLGLTANGNKSEAPVEVVSNAIVVKISSGSDHLVCLTDAGDLLTLGSAEQGQLGRVAECFSTRGGRKGLDLILSPGKVHCRRKGTKFTDMWTGQYATYAKADTGDVYAWGLNNYYQLGLKEIKNRFVPECAKSFHKTGDWKELSGGQHHTLALDGEGRVYALGRAEYGRLGLGEGATESGEPKQVAALNGKKCVSVNCGSCVSFAIAETGEVYAWGMGTNKQLGQSEEDDVWQPELLTGKQLKEKTALQVSAGGQHTVILAKNKSS